MRLKEGRDHQVYEVLDLHLEPELERRMMALGLTAGTRIEIVNNQKKGAVAFGSSISDQIQVKEAAGWGKTAG